MKRSFMTSAIAAGILSSSVPVKVMATEPHVESPVRNTRFDSNARKYAGAYYNWGGRNTTKNPGLDCLGLIFISIQDRTGISWRRWSVTPSELIAQLASKGEKQTILLAKNENQNAESLKKLQAGDFIFLLWPSKLKDSPITKNSLGEDLYVWHTAVYSEDGKIIHASPFTDKDDKDVYAVFEEPMLDFMRRNNFEGFVSVRYRR